MVEKKFRTTCQPLLLDVWVVSSVFEVVVFSAAEEKSIRCLLSFSSSSPNRGAALASIDCFSFLFFAPSATLRLNSEPGESTPRVG